MGRHRFGTAVIVGLLTVVALASCSSTVQGAGGLANDPAKVPSGLIRLTHTSPLGDPASLDLCVGLKPDALAVNGESAAFDDFSPAGGCFLDIGRRSLSARAETDEHLASFQRASETLSGLAVFTFPSVDYGCYRVVAYHSYFEVIVRVDISHSALTADQLCAQTNVLARQVAAELSSGSVSTRPSRAHPLTSYDMCSVLRRIPLDKIRGSGLTSLAGAPFKTYFFGTACEIDTGSVTIALTSYVDVHPLSLGGPSHRDGHDLWTIHTTDTECRLASLEGAVEPAPSQELLTVSLYRSATVGAGAPDLCAMTSEILVDALRQMGRG